MALSYPGAQTRNLRIAGPSLFLLLHIQMPSRCLCCQLVFPHDPYSQLSLLRSGPGHVTAFLGHPISLLTGYPVFISSPPPPNNNNNKKNANLTLQNGAQSICYSIHNAFIPWSWPRPPWRHTKVYIAFLYFSGMNFSRCNSGPLCTLIDESGRKIWAHSAQQLLDFLTDLVQRRAARALSCMDT